MQVKAQLNYLRIAPRKVRLIADLIRGKKVNEAKTLLDFSLKRGAKPLRKLLDSAIANARHNFQLDQNSLYISKITVDEGPKLKRWRARARGRAAEIQKKTSHITLVLEGEKRKEIEKPRERKPKIKAEKKEERELKPKTMPEAPKPEKEIAPPKIEKKGWKRIFRRKAF
jgi:large subunit ribosomal protein L22